MRPARYFSIIQLSNSRALAQSRNLSLKRPRLARKFRKRNSLFYETPLLSFMPDFLSFVLWYLKIKIQRIIMNAQGEKEGLMIRIAVCDDQEIVCENVRKMILHEEEDRYEVDLFRSGKELLEAGRKYDILFLDIDMPGMDGIMTAKEIRKTDKQVEIIYITNYGGYAGYAFGVHAFGYLLKPVKEKEIKRQLKEALEYMQKENQKPVVDLLTKEGRIRIPAEEIYYFEYTFRMLEVHTKEGVYYQQAKISECLEKMRPYGFAMPHKSFVVNLDQVRGIKGYEITMMDGSVLPLSQKKGKAFREELNLFLAGRL